MEANKKTLLFNTKLTSFEKINDSFLRAKCYVMALGKNRNKSHFTKENVDRAYPTLAYIPVIGHLMCDENGTYYLGSHDVKLDINTLKLKSQCVPFGVVIPSEEPVYESVTEEDGTIATYLTTDVVIWTGRYPELTDAFYDEETFCNQSMEIRYEKAMSLKDDPSYTDIIDFTFDALCMLMKSDDDKFNKNPCFPSSSIKAAEFSADENGEFETLFSEMKNELRLVFESNEEKQGGSTLNEKDVILQKYGKTIEDLNFSIDDMSVEEFEMKMEELFGEKEPESEPLAFSATYRQKYDALRAAFTDNVVRDENGNYVEETCYYINDFDETHVYVEISHWTQDNYNCKFVRYSYSMNEDLTVTVSDEYEEMVRVWLTLEENQKINEERDKYEALSEEFSTYKSEHSYTNSEYETLKEFEEKTNKDKRETDEAAVFSAFEGKIGKTEEFAKLKETASEFTIDDLKKECLCIVGMYAVAETPDDNKEEKKPDGLKFSFERQEEEEDPYGGVIAKYLKK